MTDAEKEQYSQRVKRELFQDGTSEKAVKNNLRILNRELDADLADVRFNVNKGKIPEYVERNKLVDIQEKREIIQAIFNNSIEKSSRSKQIEIVKKVSDVTGTEFITSQKLIARLIALFFVFAVWSIVFLALYIFLIKDSELGRNSLLGILVTIISAIVIFEIAMGGQNIILGFIFKISRFVYRFVFRQSFLIFGGTEEELERMRRRKKYYSD